MKSQSSSDQNIPANLPAHLGFIVDGNRRWAKERLLPTLEGHRKGFKKVEMIADYALEQGIKFVSFFLFSTENWGRSPEEVAYLMDLVQKNIFKFAKKLQTKNYRCLILGRPEPAPAEIWAKLLEAEKLTQDCTGGTVCICFNYGGQQEIVDAVNKAIQDQAQSLTIQGFNKYIYHPEVPPVDMIVRTSGEERISGFMLWRAAYSEFLFLKKYFPAITKKDFDRILTEYASRQRRFGK